MMHLIRKFLNAGKMSILPTDEEILQRINNEYAQRPSSTAVISITKDTSAPTSFLLKQSKKQAGLKQKTKLLEMTRGYNDAQTELNSNSLIGTIYGTGDIPLLGIPGTILNGIDSGLTYLYGNLTDNPYYIGRANALWDNANHLASLQIIPLGVTAGAMTGAGPVLIGGLSAAGVADAVDKANYLGWNGNNTSEFLLSTMPYWMTNSNIARLDNLALKGINWFNENYEVKPSPYLAMNFNMPSISKRPRKLTSIINRDKFNYENWLDKIFSQKPKFKLSGGQWIESSKRQAPLYYTMELNDGTKVILLPEDVSRIILDFHDVPEQYFITPEELNMFNWQLKRRGKRSSILEMFTNPEKANQKPFNISYLEDFKDTDPVIDPRGVIYSEGNSLPAYTTQHNLGDKEFDLSPWEELEYNVPQQVYALPTKGKLFQSEDGSLYIKTATEHIPVTKQLAADFVNRSKLQDGIEIVSKRKPGAKKKTTQTDTLTSGPTIEIKNKSKNRTPIKKSSGIWDDNRRKGVHIFKEDDGKGGIKYTLIDHGKVRELSEEEAEHFAVLYRDEYPNLIEDRTLAIKQQLQAERQSAKDLRAADRLEERKKRQKWHESVSYNKQAKLSRQVYEYNKAHRYDFVTGSDGKKYRIKLRIRFDGQKEEYLEPVFDYKLI